MSARRSAGASLTPSPVIATTWPCRAQRVGDAQLRLRASAGEDQLAARRASSASSSRRSSRSSSLAGDDRRRRRRRCRPGGRSRPRSAPWSPVIDDDADAGARGSARRRRRPPGAAGRASRRARAGQVALGLLAVGRAPRRRASARRATREHAQPSAGVAVHCRGDPVAVGVVERPLAAVAATVRAARRAPPPARPWCATTARPSALVDRRHQLAAAGRSGTVAAARSRVGARPSAPSAAAACSSATRSGRRPRSPVARELGVVARAAACGELAAPARRDRRPTLGSRLDSPDGVQTAIDPHPVLGQRAGLVGADHGRSSRASRPRSGA